MKNSRDPSKKSSKLTFAKLDQQVSLAGAERNQLNARLVGHKICRR